MTSHAKIIIAIVHIRDWLVSTGALAGKKDSGFRANWSAAKQFPELMDWFKENRGMSPKSYYSAPKHFALVCDWSYKRLINILAGYHNLEKSYDIGPCALMISCQEDINTRVFEIAEENERNAAYRKERDRQQAIADNALPQLLAELQEIIEKRKALENEFAIWKSKCKETHNTVLANTHHRNSWHAHNLP